MLLTMTPVGLAWGLIEAARFHWWLAVLMGVLLSVISLFIWSVVRRVRAESLAARSEHGPPDRMSR